MKTEKLKYKNLSCAQATYKRKETSLRDKILFQNETMIYEVEVQSQIKDAGNNI